MARTKQSALTAEQIRERDRLARKERRDRAKAAAAQEQTADWRGEPDPLGGSSAPTEAASSGSGRAGEDGEPSSEAWAELFRREEAANAMLLTLQGVEKQILEGTFRPGVIEQFQKQRQELDEREMLLRRAITMDGALAAALRGIGGRVSAIQIQAMANGWIISYAPSPVGYWSPDRRYPEVVAEAHAFDQPQRAAARDTDRVYQSGDPRLSEPPRPLVVMTADQLADAVRSWAVADQVQHHARRLG